LYETFGRRLDEVVFMIPGEYMEAKVGRDRDFSLEVYQWCSLDYSCFEVWVIVCNALLNLLIGELRFRNNVEGNWKYVGLLVDCKDLFKEY
jgi:hypothetical protein